MKKWIPYKELHQIREQLAKKGDRIREISRTYGRRKGLLLIEKVPIVDCPHGGKNHITADTLHEIERIELYRRGLRAMPCPGRHFLSLRKFGTKGGSVCDI
jgi:hypothetical protein